MKVVEINIDFFQGLRSQRCYQNNFNLGLNRNLIQSISILLLAYQHFLQLINQSLDFGVKLIKVHSRYQLIALNPYPIFRFIIL